MAPSLRWDEAAGTLTISGSPVERQVSVRRVDVEPGRFTGAACGGRLLPVERGSLNGELAYGRMAVGGEVAMFRWRG